MKTPSSSSGSAKPPRRSSRPALLRMLAIAFVAPLTAHFGLVAATTMTPPTIAVQLGEASAPAADDPSRRELGPSYVRTRGAITEIRLVGSPEQIGHAHGRLLYQRLVRSELAVQHQFRQFVPWPPLRLLIMDLARWRFRHLDQALTITRRREIAAQAAAFQPDPFVGMMATYQRFVFLQSLYDVMLSFEGSPLVGCTSFVLAGRASAQEHTVMARSFDLEGPEVLDANKAVFLVLPNGRIPFASISWPGFVGVTTGMNAAGLAIAIHGGRARQPAPQGEPVVQTVRDLLGLARDVDEALALLQERQPMVSHMLLMADGSGQAVVVERAPGEGIHPRWLPSEGKLPLTNHFEGPLASDPANQRVLQASSTRARRERLDELLATLEPGATIQQTVKLLRDKRGVGGAELPVGHRHAIDALIATHGVVMDTTARVLWVSEGPHLAGRFVRFDLAELLAPTYQPSSPAALDVIAADGILTDGTYERWHAAGSPHPSAAH